MTTETEPTTALACIDCGHAVSFPIWMLELLQWPRLHRVGALCDLCRERRHARRREVVS